MSIASPNVPSGAERVADPSPRATRENQVQRWAAELLGRRAFWILFVLVAFSWPIWRVVQKALPPKLPVLGSIEAFELVDQMGRPFGATDLKGRVWMLSVIHTSSPSADALATVLGKIQHRVRNLGPAFHIVTVGLDPAADAPDRLLDFTSHHRVSPRIWSFLSGEPENLRRAQTALGLQRFGSRAAADAKPAALGAPSAAGVARDALPAMSDTSGNPFSVLVVDERMQVRGRYDLTNPTDVDLLLYHVGLLVNRGD